jgi:hypothetical protein
VNAVDSKLSAFRINRGASIASSDGLSVAYCMFKIFHPVVNFYFIIPMVLVSACYY